MSTQPTLLRSAIKRIRLRTALHLFLGMAILLLFAFLWIHIPDSHAWQLVFSFLLAAALLVGTIWLYTGVIRSIRQAEVACSRWLSALILLGWAVVKWALVTLAFIIDTDAASKRAGYWNSQLSASMRHVFTYDRLLAWQKDFVVLLVWFIIPALLLPFVIETVASGLKKGAWPSAMRTLRRWQHWIAVAVFTAAVYQLTKHILSWHPFHSVGVELFSLAARLAIVYTADVILVLLLFAVDSELLAREHSARNTTA